MTDSHPLDAQIAQVNQRLKVAQMGLQVERRGEKLNLRGTLPPRPHSHRLRSHQQRIPLGLPATKAGLKQVEQAAKVVAAKLIQTQFDWRDYLPGSSGIRLTGASLGEQIEVFRQQFFTTPQGTSQTAAAKTTWEKAYAPYLRQLSAIAAQHPNLTLPEAIYATVKATRIHSRSRQVCCTALGALAEFLNLELPTDLKQFWGNYGTSQTQLRELPDDATIVAWFDQIPNPHWRYVYGMMATYGLRNHEVFFCNCDRLVAQDPDASVEVLETTKTGYHEVWPFHPDWVEQFHLREGNLPNIQTDLNHTTLQRIGQQVTTQFRRYGLPFSPYDLRHAWAVRTIHFGLPDTVAARMMGHSVAIHNRTYHRWLTRRDQQQAVHLALQNHRPSTPTKHQAD